MGEIKKIAIVGPESTGKSLLAEQAAEALQTVWVPEYAREYLKTLSGKYSAKDIENIGLGQDTSEQELLPKAENFLVCDTTPLVEKVWMEHAFGFCSNALYQTVLKGEYDYWFLTDIDIPWEPDPLREHPHLREHFISIYKSQLTALGVSYTVVSGSPKVRLNTLLNHL